MPRHATAPDLGALRAELRRIDGRGYRAYRDIEGRFALDGATLFVDHVQGDPFAAPSRVRVRIPVERAGWPEALWDTPVRRTALADFLAREVAARLLERGGARSGSGRSGLIAVDAGGQEVLERSALRISDDGFEVRLELGLPAAGRRVRGRAAEALLCDELPERVDAALLAEPAAVADARRFVACVENQEALRGALAARGLVAFVADGAVLPRESGASDRPLPGDGAVPFASPASLRVELPLPHTPQGDPGPGSIAGMGIPIGVTLIVGGGYHGKSTLLRALERGVYPHVPGDGREYVVALPTAAKIRAEDGRSVRGVDISGFVGTLPGDRSTRAFSTDDASGSTSQAACIVEALEAGARALLLDEDTCATNFMVRDARMQALVHKRDEPITPFVERVHELHERFGISTVLVMGGCGDYFEAADTVIRMRDYRPEDASEEARAVARAHPTARRPEAPAPLPEPGARAPERSGLDPSRGSRAERVDARGRDEIAFGRESIGLRAVEQIVDPSQARAIAGALLLALRQLIDGRRGLAAILDALDETLERDGIDALRVRGRAGEHPGNLARPRRLEIAAALNRLRTLRIAPADPP